MEITILHLSDLQFGRHHVNKEGQRQPLYVDDNYNAELQKIIDDLNILAEDGIVPNFIVITGDIAEWSLQEEYKQAEEFLSGICMHLKLDRRYVVMVPGNHDINRQLCEAARLTAQAKKIEFNAPYYAKFEHYADFFNGFYKDVKWEENDHPFNFCEDSLFVNFYFPEQGIIFIGLNSCIDESECDPHYGNITVEQLQRATLEVNKLDREKKLLRIAVLHHNFQRGSDHDNENLKDADELLPLFSKESYHLLLHGHRHISQKGITGEANTSINILATGSAGLDSETLPANCRRYQVIKIIDKEISLYKRCFDDTHSYLSGRGCWKPDLNPDQRDIYEKFMITNRVNPSSSVKDKLQIASEKIKIEELDNDSECELANRFKKSKINRVDFDPLESDTIRLMASEIEGHLEYFGGRDDLIQKIKKMMKEFKNGKYILLTGSEAKGKSAVCAAIAESFITENIDGEYPQTVNKKAPWLPKVLFISGKVIKEPKEILRLLLAQANTLLMEPVISSLCETEEKNYYQGLYSSSDNVIDINNSYNNNFCSTTSPLKTEYRLAGRLSTKLEKKESNCAPYRKEIYLLMEKLVSKLGRVYLIIDALDEMDNETLEFLPERMPNNVSTLLTVRLGTHADVWAKDYLKDYEPIKLYDLSRDEIPLITGVNDDESDEHRNFNNTVMKKTGGWSLLVIDVAQKVRANGGDFTAIAVDEKIDIVLEKKANQWSAVNENGQDILREILFLLAIFEPICSLGLNLIQSYLLKRFGQTIELQLLRKKMCNVASQIDGLSISNIKLSLQVSAEYVRDRHCSQLELNEYMKSIVNWLAEDEEVNDKLVVDFLAYWTNQKKVGKRIYDTVSSLFQILIENERVDVLRVFALKVPSSNFSLKCLQAAATLGDTEAMNSLALWLFNGFNSEADVEAGEFWLREAAGKNNKAAMVNLGNSLIDGVRLTKDPVEGLKWLEKAVLADEHRATFYLSLRLLNGDGLEKDIVKGEYLLRCAAEAGNEKAITELANRLIDGNGLPQNNSEGVELLQETIDSGNISAMRMFAYRLINGIGIEQDKKRGIEVLRKASYAGDMESSITLAEILLDPMMSDTEHKQGEKFLAEAAKKSEEAQIILGSRLIEGKGVGRNIKAGEVLFKNAIANNSNSARMELAEYLIEGKFLKRDVNRGKRLLLTAIEQGETLAMAYLGNLLLEGVHITKNKLQGVELLLRAIEDGEERAMLYLGVEYLQGKNIEQNITEGKRLLESAIDRNYCPAIHAMGVALLSGEVLAQNIPEAIQYLERAAKEDYTPSQCELGKILWQNEYVEPNLPKAKEWLEKATSDRDGIAEECLGHFYYAQGMYSDAAKSFVDSFIYGGYVAGINAAYMKRKMREITNVVFPPVQYLLAAALKERDPYAIINYALCFACGFESNIDWNEADNLILSIGTLSQEDIKWWIDLRLKDDTEAHLVIAWLVKHELLIDPDGLSFVERMNMAKVDWDIPEWLFLNKNMAMRRIQH